MSLFFSLFIIHFDLHVPPYLFAFASSDDPVLNIRSHHYHYDTLTWNCSLIVFMVAVATFLLNGPTSYKKAGHLLHPSSLPLLRWTLVLSVHPYLLRAVVPSFNTTGALVRIASNKRRFVWGNRRMASYAIMSVNGAVDIGHSSSFKHKSPSLKLAISGCPAFQQIHAGPYPALIFVFLIAARQRLARFSGHPADDLTVSTLRT